MARKALALAAVLLLALAAAPPAAAADASSADLAALADRVLARVNDHRVRAGLAPVALDQALGRAAQAHARDMADNEVFAHIGSDGSTIGTRARRAGYSWRRIGENIAAGAPVPEEVVEDWMESDGHRRNILEPEFVHVGVGHAFRDPDAGRLRYRHYWTLLLGAPAAH